MLQDFVQKKKILNENFTFNSDSELKLNLNILQPLQIEWHENNENFNFFNIRDTSCATYNNVTFYMC